MTSDDTRVRLNDAYSAHLAERAEAALSGQDPGQVDPAALHEAARAHLDAVDPGYDEREAGKPPADRQVAPRLKAAYDSAADAANADPGDAAKAAKAAAAGERFAAARQAARILEGRPLTTQIETPAQASGAEG